MAKDIIGIVIVALLAAILLGSSQFAYADDGDDDDADAVIDISINGEAKVDIGVSGPCELNVGAKGPAEVSIDVSDEVKLNVDVSDEVKLNVEASDESQVFLDDQGLDNPTQKPDEPAESVVPIISGVFPAAGLFAFFLIRRRAKNKVNNEGR